MKKISFDIQFVRAVKYKIREVGERFIQGWKSSNWIVQNAERFPCATNCNYASSLRFRGRILFPDKHYSR